MKQSGFFVNPPFIRRRLLPPTKRDPFRDLLLLQERMSRIFDEAILKYRAGGGITSGTWYPPVDIYETEEK
jgi:HSP20 family molecular chaperone IbpA